MINPIARWAFYVFAFSIPIEYPTPLPFQIHTGTAALFLITAVVLEPSLFRRPPAAVYWIGAYLWVYTALVLVGEHASEAVRLVIASAIVALVLWASSNVMQHTEVARRALISFVLGCLSLAVLELAGVGSSVIDPGDMARQTVFAQDPNFIGGHMALGLVAVLALLPGARHSVAGAVASVGVGALLANSLLAAGSRGAFAAVAAGLLAYSVAGGTSRTIVRHLTIALLVATALVWTGSRIESTRKRVERSLETGNMAGRERIYAEAWQMVLEKPVLGWGPVDARYELRLRTAGWEAEKFRRTQERDAHNLVLEALIGLGVAGTTPFLTAIGLCAFAAWRGRAGPHGAAAFALVATVLVLGMSANWSMSKEAGLFFGYGLAARRAGPL